MKREWLIGACGLSLAALTTYAVTFPHPIAGEFGIGYGTQLSKFVSIGCLQGLIYFGACALTLRMGAQPRIVGLILGLAAFLRLIALSEPPFLSNDVYRYVWDGWVQAVGINPYRYLPSDQHLAMLRDAEVYPNINRANYAHTIYPPGAEIIFFGITKADSLLGLPPILGMKLALVTFEAIGIWAMLIMLDLADLPRNRILLYAWNPVPIWEFAGNGHVDAIIVCFVAIAIVASCKRSSMVSAGALSIAVLAKFLPAVLLPVFWRRGDWKFVGVFAGLIFLFYMPYLTVGEGVFGFLWGYGAQEGIDSGKGIFLLGALGKCLDITGFVVKLYLLLVATVLVALGAGMHFGWPVRSSNAAAIKRICQWSLLLGCVAIVGLSPHYAWYYCWLLIPICVIAIPSALYLVTASLLLYLNPVHTDLFWPTVLYGLFFILLIWDVWRGRMTMALSPLKLIEGDRI